MSYTIEDYKKEIEDWKYKNIYLNPPSIPRWFKK